MSDHGTGHHHAQPKGFLGEIDRFITTVGSVFGILTVVAIIALILIVAEFWPLWGEWASQKTNTASNSTISALNQSGLATRNISIDDTTIHAFVADTDSTRERGLGGYSALSPNEGMLFVFQQDGSYGFWMKDMSFPIDILWLDANGYVVYVQENVTPETYPTVYTSPQPARYVLELPSGFAVQNKIKINDVFTFR